MSNDEKRAALLSELWDAQAQAMLDTLKNSDPGEVRGSTLKEIRQFLLDNGVTVDTVMNGIAQEKMMKEMEADLEGMPTLEEIEAMTR